MQWYYYKNEIDYKALGLNDFKKEAICEQELFLTNHTDKAWV